MLKFSTSPHMYSANSTRKIMLDVIIALLPVMIAAILFFGLSGLLVIITSVTSCVFFEYFFQKYVFSKNASTSDLSAVVTGILLAFNLPSNISLMLVVLGSFVAIVFGKIAFGGIGKNIFNPALVGRVFLFISFPVAMNSWPKPMLLKFFEVDSVTSATPLSMLKHNAHLENLPDYMQLFLGNIGGSLGETSAIAIILGLIYLLWRKIISFHIPCFYVGTVYLLFLLMFLYTGELRYQPLLNVLSGGVLLGAVFMATDYTTSPMTNKGRVIFAVGCGVLTYIIRVYGSYPEGVSFAILIMNAFVPLIDNLCKPKLFGTR